MSTSSPCFGFSCFFCVERNLTLQEEVKVQVGDVQTLTKRNQDLSDKYTRIDIECNRVSEDLHLARNALDQLRNECANLKAEKRIWEVSPI